MSNNSKQKNRINLIVSTLLFTILLLSLFGDKGYFDYYQMKSEKEKIKSRIEELKKEKEKWLQKIHWTKTNPMYKEIRIRKSLGWVKPNEIVYIFEKEKE